MNDKATVADTAIKVVGSPQPFSALEINARRLKQRIPRSWFTKKGPGVEAKAKLAFRRLDPIDRAIVLQLGWFPMTWANLPFKPEPMLTAKTQVESDTQPLFIERAVDVAEKVIEKSKAVAGKVWGRLKRLFGGGK